MQNDIVDATTSIAASAANILRTSMYFWWIAYLRQSQDYWWVCHEKGNCQDPRLIAVWQDFGDVFSYQTLDHWWGCKGHEVFERLCQREQKPGHALELLTKENLSSISLAKNTALISVAIDADLKAAQTAFVLMLRQIQQDRILLEQSNHPLFNPPYQTLEIDPKSKKALINGYRVHLLQQYIEGLDYSHALKKWGCYEMGLHLGIAKRQTPKPIDTIAIAKKKQNCVRAVISQNKSLAKSIIANVEIGQFPSRQAIQVTTRWTAKQELAKNEAIADGTWHQDNWLSAEFAFMNPAQSRLLPVNQKSPKEEVISILDAFGNMPMRFLQTKRLASPKNL